MRRDRFVTVTRDSRVSHGPLSLPTPACPVLTSVGSYSFPCGHLKVQTLGSYRARPRRLTVESFA